MLEFYDHELKTRKKQIDYFKFAKLGIFTKRIYARQCTFSEMTKEDARDFLEKNHIQGAPRRIQKAYGLIHCGTWVACVTYAKHHRDNTTNTLNRLSFLSGVQIIGGASKLVKSSITSKTVTWSDNRWTDGKIYERIGFEFSGNLPSDYFYLNERGEYRSKQSMKVPAGISEKEYWAERGWHRIYDKGKKRWIWP